MSDAQDAWLAENTGWCTALHARITRKACEANRRKPQADFIGNKGGDRPPQCDGCRGLVPYEAKGGQEMKAERIKKQAGILAQELARLMERAGGAEFVPLSEAWKRFDDAAGRLAVGSAPFFSRLLGTLGLPVVKPKSGPARLPLGEPLRAFLAEHGLEPGLPPEPEPEPESKPEPRPAREAEPVEVAEGAATSRALHEDQVREWLRLSPSAARVCLDTLGEIMPGVVITMRVGAGREAAA